MNNSHVWMYIIAIVLVIVGSINWLSIATINYNFVEGLASSIKLPMLSKVIYILVGIAGLSLALKRDVYLPFLGQAAIPCGGSLFADKVPDKADISIPIQTIPNSKVLYWASEENANKELVKDNPWDAYAKFDNAGIVTSDNEGKAMLKVRDPTSYKVPGLIGSKTLKKHIHYRTCLSKGGILSRVETVFV